MKRVLEDQVEKISSEIGFSGWWLKELVFDEFKKDLGSYIYDSPEFRDFSLNDRRKMVKRDSNVGENLDQHVEFDLDNFSECYQEFSKCTVNQMKSINRTKKEFKKELDTLDSRRYIYQHRDEFMSTIGVVNEMLSLLSVDSHSELRNEDGSVDDSWVDTEFQKNEDVDYNQYMSDSSLYTSNYDYEDNFDGNLADNYDENSNYDGNNCNSIWVSDETEKNSNDDIELINNELNFEKSSQRTSRSIFDPSISAEPFDLYSTSINSKFTKKYGNNTVSKILSTNGWQISDNTVLHLAFRGKQLSLDKLKVESSPQGNCFLFKQPYEQATAGSGNGLTIILNVMQDYYTNQYGSTGKPSSIPEVNPEAGVKVYLFNPEVSFPKFMSGVDVSPGKKASIAMNEVHHQLMFEPWGMCNEKTQTAEYANYTLEGCLQDCYIKNVIKSCNCKPHYAVKYKAYSSTKECTLNDILKLECKTAIPRIKRVLTPTNCSCLLPCKYKDYKKSTSYSTFPSKYLASHFKEYFPKTIKTIKRGVPESELENFNLNYKDYLYENLVYLDVFFDDLKYELAEESKADKESSLISDIGGQLGLWLGCSILTLVEIVYCCCVVVPRSALQSAGMISNKKVAYDKMD